MAQNNQHTGYRMRVMSYNVENLFDTIHQKSHDDYAFTPKGTMKWTEERYYLKIKHIAQVISRVGEWRWPDVVGIMEVENGENLRDLIEHTQLKRAGYEYTISHGHDHRGIHIGLLYRKDIVKIIATYEYPVFFKEKESKVSRNILHIFAKIKNDVYVNFFLCHFPSRREGAAITEAYRCDVAEVLRQQCDSIYDRHKDCNIIIMGDFNEDPEERASIQTLDAYLDPHQVQSTNDKLVLINLFGHHQKNIPPGSYYYEGTWNQLDQIIISENILSKNNRIYYLPNTAHTYVAPFLSQGGKYDNYPIPYRTYIGRVYIGGYSDHFPIVSDFLVR